MGGTCLGGKRAWAGIALAILLATSLFPSQAWAYFNRGAVEVSLGAASVEVAAGSTVSVTAALSPASDEQLEGCGMPKCPQGCSESCLDDNGQCQCAGSDYSTYYATAVATSSDTGVAVALYDGGVLTIYGKAEGTATITVTGSLRQYTDGQATIEVTVTAGDDAAAAGDATAVEVPDEAEAVAIEDRADEVEKDVMGQTMRYVRIEEGLDAAAELTAFAGTDGDLTFWTGDTYYQPDYSLTVTGTDYESSDVSAFDAQLTVSTEASGTLSQLLSGLDGYVIVEFAQTGALPAEVLVYVRADEVLDDDAVVALYSYDEDAKAFVAEDAEASVVGGYAVFTVQEGKTYAVSTRDLASEAAEVIADSGTAAGGASVDAAASGGTPPIVYAAAAIVVLAVLLLAGGAVLYRRRGRKDA